MQHEPIELCTIYAGLEGALGEVDMLFEDIGARELAALGVVKSNGVFPRIGGLMALRGNWRKRLSFSYPWFWGMVHWLLLRIGEDRRDLLYLSYHEKDGYDDVS